MDRFSRKGFSQTFNTSSSGKLRKMTFSGQYETRIYCDHVSSVKFDGSKPILIVSKNMFCLFRPSFEVVREGRMFLAEKMMKYFRILNLGAIYK